MNKSEWLVRGAFRLEFRRWFSGVQRHNPSHYCMELVRRNDFESYLCTLLLPNDLRAPAFAIRAFNVEIALIQDQTTEAAISGMRYSFWNDTLKKIYSDNPPQAPVPLELHRILKTVKLSKHYFQRLLDARWKKWQSSDFPDLESLEKYSEDTVSPIYYLLLEARGIKDINVDHIASHLGKSQGITTLLRSIPHHAQRRVCVIPQELLIKHRVPTESVFRGEMSKELSDVIFNVASRAHQHLEKAKNLRKNTKKNLSSIFLPAVNIEKYLTQLQTFDFNVYSSSLHKKDNMLALQILKAKLFSMW
ncbi:NADH dehydrogenase (ubiquinone) complex I, assembly factor 6 [Diachasmimorpha longicaudata]|uniref:NADH dehydrogenase (ubiquinone) complex I, assembly factor 6 n=1 Tax=Diachasmimorpha longicaudata TaxID=58733 RepID=UPI0030B8E124